MCAGDGRDLIEVLGARPDVDPATAVLIENDPKNLERARERIGALGLDKVTVIEGDAARRAAYVSADLIIIAGVFGNIGAHRFAGVPKPLEADRSLFSFVDRPWNRSDAEFCSENRR